jgi:hypothetical protein
MGGAGITVDTLFLTNPAKIQHQPNLEELLSEDWRKMNGERKESRSQALGRVVVDLGEGIISTVPSSDGKNLVIYPRSLDPSKDQRRATVGTD